MFSKKEKLLLATLATIQFSHIVDFMILMPLGPQLMRIFAITPEQFGMLVSVYNFAAGIAGFLAAFFVDKMDRKKSLLFFYVGFAAATVACALSPGYSSLLFARALTGVFGGVLSSMILAIIGDSIESSRRGTAMGIVMASFSVASIFGVPFSLFLANHFSWHAPFVFLGTISFFIIILASLTLPPMRDHLKMAHKRQSPIATVLNIASSPRQVIALVFMFLLIFGQFSIIPFLSPSFVANAGLPEAQLPFIYLVGGAVSIISNPLIGRAADKYGKKLVFTVGASLSILPIFLITNLSATPLYLLLPLVAIFFMCMGGRMVPAMAMMTSTVRPESRGSFMSISSSTQQIASALASFIAGHIVIKGASGHLDNYQWVGYIAMIASILAIFMAQKITLLEEPAHKILATEGV